ncbi:hypothetical protein [Flavobacterium sp.]|uniref:hypothetical protein n=1 Tax=Flavobacterium sp. TaxID=239 RepID=UPI0031DC3ED4
MKEFIKTSKNIFLLDAFGALLTTILLFFLLKNFNDFFGLSKDIFEKLSIIAFTFFVYSISCYFLIMQNWKSFLKIICGANILYCVLTLAIIIHYYQSISILGIVYFLAEIIVIGLLASLEIKTIKTLN